MRAATPLKVDSSSQSRTIPRLLIAEDDAEVAAAVGLCLAELPCEIEVANDGELALSRAIEGHYDAIILDLSLPSLDGLAICRRLREQRLFTPILMLTARRDNVDKVVGLEAGADDYLVKPFNALELRARLKALLRRSGSYSMTASATTLLQCGEIVIDLERRVVTRRGQLIDLTAKEFDLLRLLAQHPGRVYTREQLLDAVWGVAHDGYGHTVNSHINRLRAKLEYDSAAPRYVLTVWSVGYKFCDR